jgi:acylphosphatase
MVKHLNIIVSGLVQGVFYRASACDEAKKLGITGFVQNQPDETVFIEAEGEEDALQKLVEWCKKGPPKAIVKKVDTASGEMRDYSDFVIF